MTFLSNIRQCDSCSKTEPDDPTYVRLPIMFASGPFEEPTKTTFHSCRECYPLNEVHRVKQIYVKDSSVVEIEFHVMPPSSGVVNMLQQFIEEQIL